MTREQNAGAPRLAAEIAHILFMDIVAYSLLPMEKQSRIVGELRQAVRETPEFRRAQEQNELSCLDTGDGMALLFFRDPLSPAQCAVEVVRALRKHPNVSVRMGIHSGPVSRVADINGHETFSGGGINMAQRVMDCGDPGHILVSHSCAEWLAQFEAWAASLHNLGECEVKHGVRLHLYNLYLSETGNPECPARLRSQVPAPSVMATRANTGEADTLEPAGGAVPLGSAFYIERSTDAQFRAAITRGDSIVLVKGPRQVGKTSLLARGLQQAREAGGRVVLTDLQKLTAQQIESAETLFRYLAEILAEQLELSDDFDTLWKPNLGWNVNIERFLRRKALAKVTHLVWGLDEVDRLFTCPFGSEVFGLFRSWHNERSLNPDGPWGRLTLAIAYATEAHLFITDLNQSPFNVGTRLTLEDFTPSEVAELNRRYGGPLKNAAELARLFSLLSGHPYLVRRGLEFLVTHQEGIGGLEAQADREDGPFGDHLRRIGFLLTQDALLEESVQRLLQGHPCPAENAFYRLRSAGLLLGESAVDAHLRCGLYQRYLEKRLP
jgi:hypothetical protein